MSYGEAGRSEGYKYEDTFVKYSNELYENSAAKSTQKVPSTLGDKLTTAKSDLSVFGQNISLKNPSKSSTSIQVFVTPQHNFLDSCRCSDPGVRTAVSLFFGTLDEKEFEGLLVDTGIKKEDLDYQSEIRRHRVKFYSLPQKYQDALLLFLKDNKRHLVECAVEKGWAEDRQAYAGFMLWSDSSVAGKSSLDNVCLFKMGDVVNKICEYDWDIRLPKETVFALGPLTLQMKGSCKKDKNGNRTSSYHNLQFNASLNDLRKSGIPHINGSGKYILDYLATV